MVTESRARGGRAAAVDSPVGFDVIPGFYLLRRLYTLLVTIALPILPVRLWWRGRREPGYREAIGERFGLYHDRVPAGPILWVHAVSLGETRAAQPLVRALARTYPAHRILVTHMTATGRAAARELYPDALHAWLPYDHPWLVRRFLAHFRPALGVIMETEVWPNLIHGCSVAGIPLLLANARLSDRSARGYRRFRSLAQPAFAAFDRVGAQTVDDARRLREVGAIAPIVTGNLKFDVSAPANAAQVAADLRDRIGARPVVLAASTREGEEARLLEALQAAPLGNALFVIVPRHPQRFDAVADVIRSHGFAFVRRSDGRAVPADCAVLLGDTMGELAGYYRACDIAFIGGSLVPVGGQNLIEACDAGVPVLIGPSTFNFAEATALGIAAGAVRSIDTATALFESIRALLGDPSARRDMGERGRAFCAGHRGATDRTVALVTELLAPDRPADAVIPPRRH